MTKDLRGRDITDPEVHAEVLRSIREMPFRDLVAEIEGEEAAAEMERASLSATPVTINDTSSVAAGNKTINQHTILFGQGGATPVSCPPKRY